MSYHENEIQDLEIVEELNYQIINKRLQNHSNKLNNSFVYSLRIFKTLNRMNYHQFRFKHLNDIARVLSNGQHTLAGVPNREFWKNNFDGGFRTINISQIEEEYPVFQNHFILFSQKDNLDVSIDKNLRIRSRLIDPTLQVEFIFLGLYRPELITQNITSSININYNSGMFQKLNSELQREIMNSYYHKPSFLGTLFRNQIPEE